MIKKIQLFSALIALGVSSYAYGDRAFIDIFNIYTTWGRGEIKVLEITTQDKSSPITAEEIYNPSYFNSFFYYTTFKIEYEHPISPNTYGENNRVAQDVVAKIGYNNDNYCTITIHDGAEIYATVTSTNCVGNISYDSFDDTETRGSPFLDLLTTIHNYYINFKHK